jgi:alcohol dehydrogenase class IV
MDIQNYSFPTNIQFGPGAVKNLPAYLKEQGLKKPLVITDPQVAKLPFFTAILEDLKKGDIHPQIFCEISSNPVKSNVLKGGEAYQQAKADSIIAIGGGAAMDVARGIALRIHHSRDLFDYDDLQGGSVFITEEIPPFITIPTTAGTGSEVGRSAVIAEDVSKKKRILFHPRLIARQVLVDPELTYGLPPFITAATGMDALTHHLEAFLSKGYHPMAEGIALEGIRLISKSLETAANQPNPEARSQMMIAAMMGAVAFQKGLGVVHSLAHPLSTLFDIHHGLANAICLPHGMKFNIEGNEERFERIAGAMELTNRSGEGVVKAIADLTKRIGLPQKLSLLKVQLSDLEKLSQLALEDFCHLCNPKEVRLEDFRQLYQNAL